MSALARRCFDWAIGVMRVFGMSTGLLPSRSNAQTIVSLRVAPANSHLLLNDIARLCLRVGQLGFDSSCRARLCISVLSHLVANSIARRASEDKERNCLVQLNGGFETPDQKEQCGREAKHGEQGPVRRLGLLSSLRLRARLLAPRRPHVPELPFWDVPNAVASTGVITRGTAWR